ncbi:MAG: hypothetical protein U9R15_14165, partial [Chloroflexota bacterium]|nr:hypothetical protein [Chloroflexota bacterium]
MRRRSGIVAWLVIIIAIPALFLTWQYVDYRSASRVLPAGMSMTGVAVEGMTPDHALNALKVAFATPVEVAYREQTLSLSPDSVELRHNAEETRANLDAVLAARSGFDGFIAHVLRRPPEPVDVPVAVAFSDERLDGFLARVAMQYDQPPQGPVPLPVNLTFRPGLPGYELDVERSHARLADALISATERRVELVVRTDEAPPLEMDALGQLLQSLLDDNAGLIPGIFVKDLQTGAELEINAEVAYAGLSVLKISILEETYRVLDAPLDPEMTDWLSNTLGVTSSNFQANLLLRDVIGDGDGYRGAENLTGSMNYLGLRNTFMAAPYDEVGALTIATPANSRTDITTEPDPYMQTTPLDIGLLLEMIYQCSNDGGALMVAYPDAFTADECSQMIEWLTKNRID